VKSTKVVFSSLKTLHCRASVAHACNPSYSGGRDQEDHSSKPAWANSLGDARLKTPITKRAGEVTQGEGSEFNSQCWKKKNFTIFHLFILDCLQIYEL
jgi:hypothetical protein